MDRLPFLSSCALVVALVGCQPSDFDDLDWAHGEGPIRERDAGGLDAAAGSDAGALETDAGPIDAGQSGAVDAGVAELDVALRVDDDDCLWAIMDRTQRELLRFGPDDGADGFIVEVGTDSEQARMGLRFVLDVPQGARIESAYLTLYRVGPESNTAPASTMKVQVFDTASPPACDASHLHDVPAAHAPEGLWPTWVGGYVVGPPRQETVSPELASLVQHIVDKPTWQAGSAVMLFLSPDSMSGGEFAQFSDSYAGEYPPRLSLRYRAP